MGWHQKSKSDRYEDEFIYKADERGYKEYPLTKAEEKAGRNESAMKKIMSAER